MLPFSPEQEQLVQREIQRAYQAGFAHGTSVSIRGFFASSALESLLNKLSTAPYEDVAEEAYKVADAMMLKGGYGSEEISTTK